MSPETLAHIFSFVTMLVIWIILLTFLRKMNKKMAERMKKQLGDVVAPPAKKCPPHKWNYDATGRMFCDYCHRPPGYLEKPSI